MYVYKNGTVLRGKPDKKLGKSEMVFDSVKEYTRWSELVLLERTGEIQHLRRQVPLQIQPEFQYNSEKVNEIVYKADFMYYNNGKFVVEDVKGQDRKTGKYITTKDFTLKWKLLKYRYPEYTFRIF